MTPQQRRARYRQLMKQQARYEAVWQPRILAALNRMAEPFIASVRENGSTVALANISTLVTPEPMFNVLSKLYNTVGVQAANNEYQHLIDTYPDLMNRQKAFGFNAWWRGIISRIFGEIGAEKVVSINQTEIRRLQHILEQSALQGLTNYQLAQKLKGSEVNLPRARVIARTETGFAGAIGQQIAADQSGLLFNMTWISAQRFSTRRIPRDQWDHLIMHDVSVVPGELFFVPSKTGGEFMRYPHDSNGSAGNVINCRCVAIREPVSA